MSATASTQAARLFDQHRDLLERAAHACATRGYFSPFPETPDRYPDSAAALARGEAAFRALLGQRFELDQPGEIGRLGGEISPYTGQPLGIDYPRADPDALYGAAHAAMPAWVDAGPDARVGVCLEVVQALFAELPVLLHAVMHTAGQSYAMSYAGSGTNALDRGIEAVVYAHQAMSAVPPAALWERRFGSATIRLQKRYRLVPRGVAVCFTCATFPTWNAYPALLASLATGNAVIVKPHPTGILPMALSVRVARRVLAAAGFDPNLVTMAVDSAAEPIGKLLVKHPQTAIVDFTGSARFGAWVEQNAHPALCYTETSGVNTVILESTHDLEPVVRSLATTMHLFSAQMCTSPQNIYVPRGGIDVNDRHVGVDEVCDALAAAYRGVTADPRRAASILAAVQSPSTLELIESMRAAGARQGSIVVDSAPYAHPEHPGARTATPLLLRVTPAARALYREERFGPIGFVIETDDAAAALQAATTDVRESGGITAFAYSTRDEYLAAAESAYAAAGAQLTCNLTGPMPLNFAASYSDYHVTGLNPAGNATLTDASFVAARFRIAQSRRPVA
jgi:phenylacetic acid degradation protein paaN